MSVWMTKSSGRAREYIVLQHTLKGVNHTVNGIKFRDGYAVVEKHSKTHLHLKRIPVLRAAKEHPITFLSKIRFITKPLDVKIVYGQDVYHCYVESLSKEVKDENDRLKAFAEAEQAQKIQEREAAVQMKQEIEKKLEEAEDEETIKELESQLPNIQECCYRTPQGQLCKNELFQHSPSGYCKFHILEDPKLSEYDIKVPQFLPKFERKQLREKVISKLEKVVK